MIESTREHDLCTVSLQIYYPETSIRRSEVNIITLLRGLIALKSCSLHGKTPAVVRPGPRTWEPTGECVAGT